MIVSAAIAACAGVALAITVVKGRRDVTHPAVAFGVLWFLFTALAQLRLTPFEHAWSGGFAALVFAGAVALLSAILLATGGTCTRGSMFASRAQYDGSRLMLAAGLFIVAGVAGVAAKASILGGIPLVSGRIDVLRSSAYGSEGEIRVPAWSTFLTNGFYIAFWLLLAAIWCGWARSRQRRVIVFAGLAVTVVGAFSGASRNALLFMLAVPFVAVYQACPRLSRRAVFGVAGASLLTLIAMSVIFLVRAEQREAGRVTFLSQELEETPIAARPLLPLYFGGAFPFEAERRLAAAVPGEFGYGYGVSTLQGLPDAFFPQGKSPYREIVGELTYESSAESPYWTVATYQGRALADFGAPGVVLVSILLGLLFGGVYRACRGRSGLFPLAVLGYTAYYAGFLFYDNLVSLTAMSVAFDVVVLAVVDWFARCRPEPAVPIFTARPPERERDTPALP